MSTKFYAAVNNAGTTTPGYTAGAGAMAVANGAGVLFGTPTTDAPLVVSTFLADGTPKGVYACTGRTGDTLTGLTLLSGTDATLAAGSLVRATWTAEAVGQITAAVAALQGHATDPSGLYAHAEGNTTTASGSYSHAEGYSTTVSGDVSHAEGVGTIASGNYSHAEGYYTTAAGNTSHAEGSSTTASASYSHAEGNTTTASGNYSHAEGYHTAVDGTASHAEGYYTTAAGTVSHAEGNLCEANSDYSHAGGYCSQGNLSAQWVRSDGGFDSVVGKGQHSILQLCAQTTSATPKALSIGGGYWTGENLTIRPGVTAGFLIAIVARKTDGSASAHFLRQCMIHNEAGTTALIGAVATVGTDNNAPGWAVAITADDTADALKITVTGAAATTIRWVATVCPMVEVST